MKYRRTHFLIVFIGIVLFSCKKEESPEIASDMKVFNFPVDKCITTPDNGFLLTYWSNSAYTAQYPNIIAKVDNNGTLLWKKNLNVDNYGYNGDIIQLKDGSIVSFQNIYDSTNFVTFKYYYHIVFEKYDSQGNSLYTKKLYTSDSSNLSSAKIVELSSGDLMLTGGYLGGLFTLKTDKSGNYIWGQSIFSAYYIYDINKVIEMNTNGDVLLIAAGNYYAKIDSSGVLLWEQQKPIGIYENSPTDVHKLNSNEYVITGYYDASLDALYNYQFFSYKINSLGDSLSSLIYGGSKQDFCLSSTIDPNNNLVMVGMEGRWVNSSSLNLSSIRILTVNPSLSTISSDKTYADRQDCSALSVIYNSDGSLSMVGQKLAFGNQNSKHTFFLKINPDGSL